MRGLIVDLGLCDEVLSSTVTEAEEGGAKHRSLRHGDDEVVVKLAVMDGLRKTLMHFPSDLPPFLQPCLEQTDYVLDQILSIA
jgi:hypothetical protein